MSRLLATRRSLVKKRTAASTDTNACHHMPLFKQLQTIIKFEKLTLACNLSWEGREEQGRGEKS